MVNFNGTIIASDATVLSHQNRGFQYGDALFETLRSIHSKLMFWEDHYFRLMAGMRVLRMEIPMEFTMEYLAAEIQRAVEANSLTDSPCRVRITVFRNYGGKYVPQDNKIGYLIEVSPMADAFYIIDEAAYEVELFRDHYVNPGMLSNLKSTNKLLNIVAGVFAEENDYENCLLVNTDKQLVEAINGNLFLVFGNTIKTPPLTDGCLNGIVRKKLIEIVGKSEEFEIEAVSISPFELQKADELFITNSISGVIPVTKYRKKSFENKVAKAMAAKLNTLARLT
ncbi:MAG: aminotransferase class IV [Flavobacteriaceae bacterium]|nr:aminotransferase class IV [Flavobacteriaceae bacterium]